MRRRKIYEDFEGDDVGRRRKIFAASHGTSTPIRGLFLVFGHLSFFVEARF